MRDKFFLNVKYSIDQAHGHYGIDVQGNADVPGVTDIIYKDDGKAEARVVVALEQLPLLIDALQRRLVDARREEAEMFGGHSPTQEERDLVHNGNKIGAIKMYRERLIGHGIDCSLRQAKEAIDAIVS